MTMSTILTCEGLGKKFGAVVAVSEADLELRSGRVHGVIGKNGAGKSVLMNMISGVMAPSFGALTIGSTVVDNAKWTPRNAQQFGVSLIPQEPPKFPFLTVEDYLFLGNRKAYRFGSGGQGFRTRKIAEIDEKLQLSVHRNDQMVTLPIEVQQMLAFGKAVYLENSSIILLDEITASLSSARRDALLTQIREMSDSRTFVLISHRIGEVMAACDDVTVMRDGKSVRMLEVAHTTDSELAAEIVGEAGQQPGATPLEREIGDEVLTIRSATEELVSVRRGEVVGLAGLEGSGKDEAMETAAGLLRRGPYTAHLAGSGKKISSSRHAAKSGVAYLPKKREEFGIIPSMTVLENMVLPVAIKIVRPKGMWVTSVLRKVALPLIDRLQVNPPRIDAQITSLSGGNRQKVMIGRLELMDPVCYILSEPTRGVDIGTKPQILAAIRDRLSRKSGVLMTSEAEEELIDYCDRIVVFSEGKKMTEIRRGEDSFTLDGLYRLAQGVS
jgi:ABC-type sugar transport system ATPase subunit